MAAHRVEPIAGAPFTAQFTETSNFTDRQGAQQQRTSTVYRDSQGRVREEITLPPPPPRAPSPNSTGAAPEAPSAPRGPRTMITILDPVANTVTHLNVDRQTAFVQTLPPDFFTRLQQRESRKESGQPSQAARNNVTTTTLGSKVVAGVSATGTQSTITFPARDNGTAHTMTRQTWFSPDLKLDVGSSESGERGTRSETLTSVNRAEPNPSLFQVPAGYTVVNAPEHPFGGGHRGGPGGFRGNGQDAPPPPPPPAM
ncbi:hypothetical protein [Terriglobus aquaticus]|uniref:Uncharacterized protein n=1 Tax=Terriglobus aquaticus TaxID=940139 RepID=A0ABW9KL96_9BACT|nr:hypothetical protein [Terriglobus aquaticus]